MKKIIFVLCFTLVSQSGFVHGANYEAYKIYLKGVLALKAGDFDLAQKDYEKVAAIDSDALAVLKDLMYLYWQSGNNQKAFDTAEKIEKLDGENPKTTAFLATFYLMANQPDKARMFWEKTLELDPDNETATVYLAAYYYSDNKLEESAEYWSKFLQQQPDSAAGYFQLALVQERLNMTEEALKSYDKVIELKPDAREAYLAKARIYETVKNFQMAIAEYEKFVEVFPDNMHALMYLGRSYYENQEYAKARDAFLKAKKGFSGSGNETEMASYWLGVIYEKLGNIEKAAAEFEYLSSRQKDNVAILARLGYYYSLLKNYAKADKKLQVASSKDPLNYEILYLQGLNYIDWGKYDKAIKTFEKVISLNPDFADAHYFMGSALDKIGNFEAAEKAFLRVLEINPDHTRAMNYLGYSYADRNIKLAEAEILLNRAVTLEPHNGAYLDSLGWLYYRQGKYDLAEKLIVTAANITRDPVVYEHLGDVYVEQGKINDAWVAYALAYDAGGKKSARQKLDLVQAKLPQHDFYNAVLFRADSNYKKLFSMKAGYKMKINIHSYNVKGYFYFNYVKGEGISIGIPSKFFLGGAMIYIKDGKITFEPRAIENEIPDEFRGLLSFASNIFSPDFFKQFENNAVGQKDKRITYKANDIELVLNSETGMVERITKDGVSVEPVKYKQFFSSKIPHVINVSSRKFNFKGSFEVVSVSVSDQHVRNAADESDDNDKK
ncbi:MAG: tetratricopeptide repeat protein [Endomicrobia bacterium]|nr:tetratricopeptide repeat protein [Endomicrobiia bacterium]